MKSWRNHRGNQCLGAALQSAGRCARRKPLEENLMEKKIAGLLGAMATLGAFNAAEAEPTPAPVQSADENVQLAQFYHHHHHHHHHHAGYGRYYGGGYAPRVIIVPRRYR